MSKIDDILDRLRQPIVTGRLTKREYARRSGLRHQHLRRIEDPSWNPTAEVIRKLEVGLRQRPLARAANHASVAA
jgi:3,4-dihydroxy 2-butanone 4-phosphate synthase/GTP cyclohydrolase II